jgi:prepilin-type N-terminal cleavage/methylation domain-containing protein
MNTTVHTSGDRSGFSLIELLVSMFAGSLVAGTVITLLIGQMQLSATQNRNIINQQNLRETLAYMKEEISLAGSGVSEPFVNTAATSEFEFRGDVDGDGTWDKVRYFLDNGSLKRTLSTSTNGGTSWTTVATDVLAAGVQSLTFTYYQPGNATTTTVGLVSAVQIGLVQAIDTDTTALTAGKVGEQEMVTRVTIRNRLL